MHVSRFTVVAGLTAVPAVSAFAFPGPVPTNYYVQRADEGFNPMPTKAPSVPRWSNNKRQDSSFTLEDVKPNTCGWLEGSGGTPGVAITCDTARTCMVYNPPGRNGMAGCCLSDDTQNCGWNTGCVDLSQWSTASNSPIDEFLIYCTRSAAPYCLSWIHDAYQIRDHGCGTDSSSTFETIEKTLSVSGQSTEVDLTLLPESAVTFADTAVSPNPSASVEEPPRGSDPVSPAEPTATPPPEDNGVPIGTIVGAVIGGVGGLAIIIGAIFFVCWDRKRKRRNAAAAAPAPTAVNYNAQDNKPFMAQQSPPSMYGAPGQQPYNPTGSPPPPHHSGYFAPGYQQQDNKYNPNAPQSPQQGYAQPYYAQEGQGEIRPNTMYSEGQSPPGVMQQGQSPVGGAQQQPPPKPAVHELG